MLFLCLELNGIIKNAQLACCKAILCEAISKKYDIFLLNIVMKYEIKECTILRGKGSGWSKKRVNLDGS